MTSSRITLFATGGTIANPPDIDGYLDGDALVDGVPELADVADIQVVDVARRASSAISPNVWWDLHEAIRAELAGDNPPEGIVVTHGSNTVEETAYFLNLTVDTDVPIVLTAAQRNFGTVGNDGNRNLLDAVRVATHPDAGEKGALVVLNDEIHQARDVRKEVSGRPDAWSSGEFGPIGFTDKYGLVEFYREPARRHTAASELVDVVQSAEAFPQVEVVYTTAGTDGTMIEAAADAGVDGLVVAAFPTGSVARPEEYSGQSDALADAADDGLPIVISHRGREGWPQRSMTESGGYLWGDTLRPAKARILLGLGLLKTTDHAELQRLFLEY